MLRRAAVRGECAQLSGNLTDRRSWRSNERRQRDEGNIAMKNDNPAALDLFSNYSDFMLTDDELLAIHGGATQSGSPGTDSTSAGAPSALPQAPAAPPAIVPVNVTVTYDHTPVAVTVTEAVVHSDAAGAVDDLVTHAIQAVDNFLFGPSSPPPSGGDGGDGGSHGGGGSGG
jgi:hypothetical protein